MLALGITPGWEPPTPPDLDFLDVQLGPRPDWQRAAILGAILGVSVLAVGAVVYVTRKRRRS